MNMRQFIENRNQFSSIELEQFAGKYIAWSPDGKTIVAADADPLKVIAAVKSAGYDSQDCVLSSVPLAEEIVLGGGLDE
jgi:hypothetical protein